MGVYENTRSFARPGRKGPNSWSVGARQVTYEEARDVLCVPVQVARWKPN